MRKAPVPAPTAAWRLPPERCSSHQSPKTSEKRGTAEERHPEVVGDGEGLRLLAGERAAGAQARPGQLVQPAEGEAEGGECRGDEGQIEDDPQEEAPDGGGDATAAVGEIKGAVPQSLLLGRAGGEGERSGAGFPGWVGGLGGAFFHSMLGSPVPTLPLATVVSAVAM